MNVSFLASIITAICIVESSGRTNAVNLTDGGSASYGYCGVKLSTARDMGYKGHVSDLWLNPKINKEVALRYLRHQYERYGDYWKSIAAYNAGSYRVDAKGETINRRYVEKVISTGLGAYEKYN